VDLRHYYSEPVEFEIVPRILPTADFVIDFDTLPDGRPTVPTDFYRNYETWGVHFSSISTLGNPRYPAYRSADSNVFIDVSSVKPK